MTQMVVKPEFEGICQITRDPSKRDFSTAFGSHIVQDDSFTRSEHLLSPRSGNAASVETSPKSRVYSGESGLLESSEHGTLPSPPSSRRTSEIRGGNPSTGVARDVGVREGGGGGHKLPSIRELSQAIDASPHSQRGGYQSPFSVPVAPLRTPSLPSSVPIPQGSYVDSRRPSAHIVHDMAGGSGDTGGRGKEYIRRASGGTSVPASIPFQGHGHASLPYQIPPYTAPHTYSHSGLYDQPQVGYAAPRQPGGYQNDQRQAQLPVQQQYGQQQHQQQAVAPPSRQLQQQQQQQLDEKEMGKQGLAAADPIRRAMVSAAFRRDMEKIEEFASRLYYFAAQHAPGTNKTLHVPEGARSIHYPNVSTFNEAIGQAQEISNCLSSWRDSEVTAEFAPDGMAHFAKMRGGAEPPSREMRKSIDAIEGSKAPKPAYQPVFAQEIPVDVCTVNENYKQQQEHLQSQQYVQQQQQRRASLAGPGRANSSTSSSFHTVSADHRPRAPPGRCHSCNISETPEWRRGPDGARTLCNACGLHYAKLTKKKQAAAAQASAGSGPVRSTVGSGNGSALHHGHGHAHSSHKGEQATHRQSVGI